MSVVLAPAARNVKTSTSSSKQAPEAAPASAAPGPRLLGGLFRASWPRLLVAYVLVTAENLLHLAQPWALGLAIDDLLHSSAAGLGILAGVYIGHLLTSAGRRVYDARAFTRLYADLATGLVVEQRQRGIAVSCVAARSALSREFVQFFQVYFPLVLQAVYSVVGALVILWFYDWVLTLICLALVVPACVINGFYCRKAHRLNAGLHDELEHEVGVITDAGRAAVSGHYHRVSSWRIKLADAEAMNFSAVELFVIALLGVALVRSCMLAEAQAGDIVAVFRYVILFVTALDALPPLIQHIGRLHDIGRRMQLDEIDPRS